MTVLRARGLAAAGALAVACAACLAGCGGQAAAPTVAPQDRPQVATDAARALLSKAHFPPGTLVVTSTPAGLSLPGSVVGSSNLIQRHRFYVVTGSPTAFDSWLTLHVPAGSTWQGNGSSNTGEHFFLYSWPSVDQVLAYRDLSVEVVALPGDRTGVRLDAEVSWFSAKSPSDEVPVGAKVVTVRLSKGADDGAQWVATVTDPAAIAAITAYVNRLHVNPPGVFHCPADVGGTLTIEFRRAAAAPPFATVTSELYGCGTTTVTRPGHLPGPPLVGPGLLKFVAAVVHTSA